jgi:hypothetical protein
MRHDVRLAEVALALRQLFTRRRPPPVASAGELADFLAAQSAYVSQRTVLEYCRARTGFNWDKIFKEQAFIDSLEVCRWEAYVALLAEIAELVLIRLRTRGAEAEACLPGLEEAARSALLRHPVPAHRTSWGEACADVERHLARALLAEPRAVHLVGFDAADAIFDLLPIHPDLRPEDRRMFQNSVRFGLCRAFGTIRQRLDVPALEAALRQNGTEAGAAAEPLFEKIPRT